ncbi:MAG: MBL fold metallo-hydrolase [Bacillota bacterium]
MKITYLGNSGFALERDGGILVIDCYNPAQHPLLSDVSLSTMRTVTALISHSHSDHYSPDIWKLKNARFAAGFDVPAPMGVPKMRPGQAVAPNSMQVTAYGSTDEGVSFHIVWDGVSIFHAGDLNDWHWRDEGGEAYARDAQARFLTELERIKAGVKNIDLAFFPVDPRMGSDYYRGAILFCQELHPVRLMPMHFGKSFRPPQQFYEEIAPLTTLLEPPTVEKHMLCPIAR